MIWFLTVIVAVLGIILVVMVLEIKKLVKLINRLRHKLEKMKNYQKGLSRTVNLQGMAIAAVSQNSQDDLDEFRKSFSKNTLSLGNRIGKVENWQTSVDINTKKYLEARKNESHSAEL